MKSASVREFLTYFVDISLYLKEVKAGGIIPR